MKRHALGHALFLAWRALAAAPARSLVLVLGTTVALFLPAFTYFASSHVERVLLERARSSPLVLGHKGNEFDLTMSSLYFRGTVRDTIPYRKVRELRERRAGTVVPLHVRYTSGGVPLVGTSVDYFAARGLSIAHGRSLAVLGEVVAGARVAEAIGLEVGNKLRSDLTNLYDIAGAYPQILTVVGILAPSRSPDDDVLFIDVKSAWMIDGLFHGHEEVTRDNALNPEAGEGEVLEATAALFVFNELTDANRASFHMHGNPDDAPLSAVLVFPRDRRAFDQILGDYALEELFQAVEPRDVITTILGIVLRVREGLGVYFAAVLITTAAFFVLVITLSLRLRRAEIDLMKRIGCSPHAIATIVGAEVALVILASLILSALLTALGLAVLDARLTG